MFNLNQISVSVAPSALDSNVNALTNAERLFNESDVVIDTSVINGTVTRSTNEIVSDGDLVVIRNPNFTHLSGSFSRGSFDNRDVLGREESVDGLEVFSHRTRIRVSKLHLISNRVFDVESVKEYTISHPIVTRVLANDTQREQIFSGLASSGFATEVARFVVGGSGRAKVGTKRYTFTRLMSWLRRRGIGEMNSEVNIVAAIILRTILEQFDWEFTTLAPARVNEVTSRVADINDLRDMYIEGWLAKVVPVSSAWVVKYAGNPEVTSAAVEEVIDSSVARLRRAMMQINLLNNRYSDVVAAARLLAALNLGLVDQIGNETLFAFINSSAAVQEMSEWYSIISDAMDPESRHAMTISTHVGDLSLLNSFADDFVAAVNGNPLVRSMTASEFLRHVSVEHYSTNTLTNSLRYHTRVTGNLSSSFAPRHYIQASLGSNLYGIDIVRENNTFNDDIAKALNRCYDSAVRYLGERDSIVTYGTLSAFTDPEDVLTNGRHGFSFSGISSKDIEMLAMLNFEMLIRYVRMVDETTGSSFIRVVRSSYIIHNVAESVANPYPSINEVVYVTSPMIAVCFMTGALAGTGTSPLLEVDLDVTKVDYLFDKLDRSLSSVYVRSLPRAFILSMQLSDAAGGTVNVQNNIDVRKYLSMSAIDDTFALIPRSTMAQLSVVAYAMDIASSKVEFEGSNTQYAYDMERVNANFMIEIYDALQANVILRNMATNVRFDCARQLAGAVASFTSAYNNTELQIQSNLGVVGIPLQLYAGHMDVNDEARAVITGTALIAGYGNNRLFKDAVLSRILKQVR